MDDDQTMRRAESRERIVLAVLNHRMHRKGNNQEDFKTIITEVIEGSERIAEWAAGNEDNTKASAGKKEGAHRLDEDPVKKEGPRPPLPPGYVDTTE